jgi:hypothetical protein
MQQSWQMRFGRLYENQTLLAARSKRVTAQNLKNRKNTSYSAVNLQKRDEISGVSVHHATYGWKRSVMQETESLMRLVNPFFGWLSPFSLLFPGL